MGKNWTPNPISKWITIHWRFASEKQSLRHEQTTDEIFFHSHAKHQTYINKLPFSLGSPDSPWIYYFSEKECQKIYVCEIIIKYTRCYHFVFVSLKRRRKRFQGMRWQNNKPRKQYDLWTIIIFNFSFIVIFLDPFFRTAAAYANKIFMKNIFQVNVMADPKICRCKF